MKSLVVLSDVHVGSREAVSPLTFERTDGGTYSANDKQRALFAHWSAVVKAWKNPDILVLNGEPVDGQQPKDKGVGAWTTDWNDQINAAVQLVKMFGAKKIYVTRGSNYHVELGGVSIEEIFGERVGATRNPKGDGNFIFNELFLDVEDTKFHFAHHVSGSLSGWMYRSTPPAKEMMLAQLNQSHKWPFDVLVRSHNHYYWFVGSSSKLALLTPAWQLQTWFAMRKTSAGSIPDIGAVRFEVEGAQYNWAPMLMKPTETTKPPKMRA